MQNQLERFARQTLIDGLHQCTEPQQLLFKRMYAGGDLELNIETVVLNMDESKLDWAMEQVQRTLDKGVQNANRPNQ